MGNHESYLPRTIQLGIYALAIQFGLPRSGKMKHQARAPRPGVQDRLESKVRPAA